MYTVPNRYRPIDSNKYNECFSHSGQSVLTKQGITVTVERKHRSRAILSCGHRLKRLRHTNLFNFILFFHI